jgi:hypothetical protein
MSNTDTPDDAKLAAKEESSKGWTDRSRGLGAAMWRQAGGVDAIERERDSWAVPETIPPGIFSSATDPRRSFRGS